MKNECFVKGREYKGKEMNWVGEMDLHRTVSTWGCKAAIYKGVARVVGKGSDRGVRLALCGKDDESIIVRTFSTTKDAKEFCDSYNGIPSY
jgi:hypothetical protein